MSNHVVRLRKKNKERRQLEQYQMLSRKFAGKASVGGFETLSGTWNRFNFRYYSFALIFVIFDVEVVFLFPWAANFGALSAQFGAFVLLEMAAFVAILLLGWLYAWRKGALQWS